jgi:hypothetical protein
MTVESDIQSLMGTVSALIQNSEAAVKVAVDLQIKLDILRLKLIEGGAAGGESRTRDDVTRIIVEEFAKQTSYLPGDGDITDPNKAIQLWTSNFVDNHSALTAPESELRKKIADMVAIDVIKYQWPGPTGPEISGQANMP